MRVNFSQSANNRAFVALGGNLDTVAASVLEALDISCTTLVSEGIEITGTSRTYLTPGFPKGSGPDYLNRVIEVRASQTPAELLKIMHEIESMFGRVRDTRWAGRTLDMDLLSYEKCILPNMETYQAWVDLPLVEQMQVAPDTLILPHPRIQDRGFVLIPLCDFRPDWMHPVLNKTALELCDALPEGALEGIVAL